ncbi:hypothetical protein L7F22_002741 [Adiantum nelumboides]|nr:hypothetical protein [Adiantum nelumboides]
MDKEAVKGEVEEGGAAAEDRDTEAVQVKVEVGSIDVVATVAATAAEAHHGLQLRVAHVLQAEATALSPQALQGDGARARICELFKAPGQLLHQPLLTQPLSHGWQQVPEIPPI